jgi:histidinol-phosphatase
MAPPYRAILDFAVETAYRAGRLTLGHFHAGTGSEYKTDDTPVTIADRQAETLIRDRIQRRYPEHAVVGEEYGAGGGDQAGMTWYIDPIDGTKSFIRGIPLYGVLLGLMVDGRNEVGAAYFPALDEMICAATGEGCFWNGRRCRVSPAEDLCRGFVSCTDPGNFGGGDQEAAWQRIQKACYYRVGLPDAYGHALVATGRLEVMLDPVICPWDCGPFPVILREAGGYFGDWSGRETINGQNALSTSKRLLPQVLDILGSAAG